MDFAAMARAGLARHADEVPSAEVNEQLTDARVLPGLGRRAGGGYENAPATRLLATHCCVCGRPLVDAASVEAGMGPDCREKYGYTAVPEAAREEANGLVHRIAVGLLSAAEKAAAIDRCRQLGMVRLAQRLVERAGGVEVSEEAGELLVRTPYNEAATLSWRRIPGRRWDKEAKANRVPLAQKRALWELLQRHFAGEMLVGPKGVSIIG